MKRRLFEAEHEAFRESVREFIGREVLPHREEWDRAGIVDRKLFTAAGAQGLLGIDIAEEHGGGGVDDFRYRCVIMEELAREALAAIHICFTLQDDIVSPYLRDLCTDEQRRRWLPGVASGEIITAIGMTEPGAGSDLRGTRTVALPDGDGWILNGAKTFISNGINADLVVVLARTDPAAGSRGFSLLVVEAGMPGFERGRNLAKVGLHAQDTAELHFQDVRIPRENLLGTEGRGFIHLMERLPRERLAIAVFGLAVAEHALAWTVDHTRVREAFGAPLATLQNTKFKLAEMATEIDVTRSYIDQSVLALNAGELTATDAAKAKWWATDVQLRVVDTCVQLHGGYGYMTEYPIARVWQDSRIQSIYGGTNEVMKEVIGRELAAG